MYYYIKISYKYQKIKMSSSISIGLPLTLSYAILDYKDEPCENGFFNIYIKCSCYIIAKMAFTFQPKYVEYLDNLKKNISKMKRRVSMDVKHGLTIDNLVFKYMSAQKMIKNDGDESKKYGFTHIFIKILISIYIFNRIIIIIYNIIINFKCFFFIFIIYINH